MRWLIENWEMRNDRRQRTSARMKINEYSNWNRKSSQLSKFYFDNAYKFSSWISRVNNLMNNNKFNSVKYIYI